MGDTKPFTRRRRAGTVAAAGGTAAALAVLGVAAAGPAAAAPASGWAPTATQALQLAGATALGAAPAGTPLRLTVGLAPQNRAGLDALVRAQNTPGSAQYGQYLTANEFTDRFGATQATATAVAGYLTSAGMTGVTVSSNRLVVTADAAVAQAESAFHTTIEQFSQGGRTVLANTSAAQVPASLAGDVTAVTGLSTLGFRLATPKLPKLTGFYPKQFDTVYDTASTAPGTGMSLAVIAEGDVTPTINDLRTAEAAQGLPQVPVNVVHTGPTSPDTSGDIEWNLDTQTSTGVAPSVTSLIMYVATSLTDSDLARAVNQFAADNQAIAGSASLGECDVLPFLDGSMAIDDMAFEEAAVQGQTFFASSGDNGSACPVLPTNGAPASGPPDTSYPASSPYVVAVGGTTLDATSANVYQHEIAWYAGGGGISPLEYPGYWQDAVVPSAKVPVNPLRGVPDIAFDADPNTGALIYVGGTTEQVGGTSLSSPLAMGLWTRIQATHNGGLGFAAPKLYGLYTAAQKGSPLPPSAVPGFHDVVLGSNGAYAATPGWDYTTGLGSWDVAKLSAALQ